jgi:hypothetical protein
MMTVKVAEENGFYIDLLKHFSRKVPGERFS